MTAIAVVDALMHNDENWLTRVEAERRYVTLDRYLPIERLVYGGVALVLTAVVVGLLAMVVGR